MKKKKKAMISQPMWGRTEEEILFIRKKATEELEKLGYEVVDSFFTREWVNENSKGIKNKALWCLAKSIEIMSQCDAVYFVYGWHRARGCRIERGVAKVYGLSILEDTQKN